MKFVLEVDLATLNPDADAAPELGRILRYWAGNLHHYSLTTGDTSALYDSTYREVGDWHIE